MPIKLACDCGRNLIVPDERAGWSVQCPKCGRRVSIPGERRNVASPRLQPPVVERAPAAASGQRPDSGRAKHGEAMKPAKASRSESQQAKKRPTPPPLKPRILEQVQAHTEPTPPSSPGPPSSPESTPAEPGSPSGPPPITLPTEPIAPSARQRPREPQEDTLVAPLATTPAPSRASSSTASSSPPPPAPAAPAGVASTANVAVRYGYQPDQEKLGAAYLLAMLVALLGIFSMIPATYDVVRYLSNTDSEFVGRWAFMLFFLGLIHLAYAIYLAQLPDWSSAWVLTGVTLGQGAIYAMLLTAIYLVRGRSQLVQALDLGPYVDNGQAIAWCFIMLLLTGLTAYFCGRVSIRWRRSYLLVRRAYSPAA